MLPSTFGRSRIACASLFLTLASLAGCSSTPDCASSATTKQLTELLKQNRPPNDMLGHLMNAPSVAGVVARQGKGADALAFGGPGPLIVANRAVNDALTALYVNSTFSFEQVRTVNKDAATGNLRCAATMRVAFPNSEGTVTRGLSYQVEPTADGSVYVTAHSLY